MFYVVFFNWDKWCFEKCIFFMKDKMKNMFVFYLFICILNVYLIKYVGVFLIVNYCVDYKENF